MYVYLYIHTPVNTLPGVETNGSLIKWSMVSSWVTGCRLLATWLHTGYPVTDYLVTGCWLCKQCHTVAHAPRTVHHKIRE